MLQTDQHFFFVVFFFNETATTEIYTLSLHDALPISAPGSHLEDHPDRPRAAAGRRDPRGSALLRAGDRGARSAPRRRRGRRAARGDRAFGRCRMSAQQLPVPALASDGVGTMIGRRTRDWFPALIVLVAGVGLWEGLVRGLSVQRFLHPAPSAIWTAFFDNQSALWHEGWFTLQEALGGFAIGCGFGILFAIVVARYDLLGSALMPYAIAANAIPIIALDRKS